MITKKTIPHWKLEEFNYLVDLLKQNKNIAVIEVAHINDNQIQAIRKTLRGKAIIRMSKKNIQIRAIEKYSKESKKSNLDELAKNIPGQASLVFTNMDLFELKKKFNENMWMVPAKPDEITPVDIWVPAGDTGLPTGQVISELNMILRLPTRIQNDTIWIREDTRTHKAGDFVDIKQAAVLKKLGVAPIESLIKIYFAWSDGEIISEETLYMDMEKFQQDFSSCVLAAKNIAMELGIIDNETIEPLIQKALREALGVLLEMPFSEEDILEEYAKKAGFNVNAVREMISGTDTVTSAKKKSPKQKDKKPKEKDNKSPEIGKLFE